MAITERQAELRRKHLGSSDAAAILGLSPWRSPRDVWIEKTQNLKESEPNPAMEIGNRFEPVVIDYALERLGAEKAARRNIRRVAKNGIMAANLDCSIYEQNGTTERAIPLEVKWASDPSEWGKEEDGLDGVPLHYAVQPMHQMICTGAPRAFLAVCLHGYRAPEFRLYEIVPTAEMLASLEGKEVRWWKEHVEGNTPPDDTEPASIETLSRILRTPGKTITVPDDIVQTWRDFDALAKKHEKLADEWKARVLEALGDAETGISSIGSVSYKTQKRSAYTVQAAEFRVCRFTANKQAIQPANA